MTNKQGVIIIHRVKSAAAEKFLWVMATLPIFTCLIRGLLGSVVKAVCVPKVPLIRKKTTITLCLLYQTTQRQYRINPSHKFRDYFVVNFHYLRKWFINDKRIQSVLFQSVFGGQL